MNAVSLSLSLTPSFFAVVCPSGIFIAQIHGTPAFGGFLAVGASKAHDGFSPACEESPLLLASGFEPRGHVGREVSSQRSPSFVRSTGLDFRCWVSLFCLLLEKQQLEEK